jgi:hypothetical protein
MGWNRRGNDVMAAVGMVSDQAARDIPQLADSPINPEPMDGSPWRYRERLGYQPPHGWPTECRIPGTVYLSIYK